MLNEIKTEDKPIVMNTFTVTLKKLTKRAPITLEVTLKHSSSAEPIDLWPELALRILSDPKGSPLAGAPLYDDVWLAENTAKFIGDVTLLKSRGVDATYRIILNDSALAKVLKKGLSWETTHYPTSRPAILNAAWTSDGKSALVGYSNGLARLIGVTKKGLGRPKALLNHPGLCAVGCTPDGLMTAGRDAVIIWDAKGKKPHTTHTFDNAVTATCVLGASVVVGLSDGSVSVIDGIRYAEPGQAALTVLAAGEDRLVAGFADGRVIEWSLDGVEQTSTRHDHAITALGYDQGGDLMIASAGAAVQIGEARETLGAAEGFWFRASTLSPTADELLGATDKGHVCVVRLADGVMTNLASIPHVETLQYSPSGRLRVVHAAYPPRLYLWNEEGVLLRMISGFPIGSLQKDNGAQVSACFSPSERLIAVHRKDKKYKDGAVIVFEVRGGGSIVLPNEDTDYAWAESIVWLDEDRLLVSYANEPDKIWTLSTQTAQRLDGDHFSSQYVPTTIGVVCQYQAIDTAELKIISREDLSVVAEFSIKGLFGSSFPPRAQASRDGRVVLLSNPFQDIAVLTKDGAPWVLKGTHDDFESVHLSSSGRWLVVLRKQSKVELWDVAARKVAAVADDEIQYAKFFFNADESAILCVEGQQVRSMALDGALSPVFKADTTSPPDRVIAVHALPGKDPIFVTRAENHRFKKTDRGGTRYDGHKIISPDGTRALTLWEHDCDVFDIRWL